MSKPTLKDFLESAAKWRGEHKGISFELSWHGCSEYSPQGTWCYYLFVNSQQFYADDWAKLRLKEESREFAGTWRRHYDYDRFPDLEAHGGWTFGELSTYLGKDGVEYELVKVGCDYAHLWDRESDYWQGRETIERDAKRSIDLLCEMFPRQRQRCGYSGKYDDAEQFYTAKNGNIVHKSHQDKLPEGWALWQPAEEFARTTGKGT